VLPVAYLDSSLGGCSAVGARVGGLDGGSRRISPFRAAPYAGWVWRLREQGPCLGRQCRLGRRCGA
jgi:hypothetical protein